MKNQVLFFWAFFLPLGLSAQLRFPLHSSADSLRFMLSDKAGKLALDFQQPARHSTGSGALPSLLGINLEDADLVLDYQFKRLKRRFAYQVKLELLGPDGRPLPRGLSEITEPGGGRKNRTGQLRWMDATENALDYGQAYTLIFHKSLLGVVDCQGKRPAFGLNKQWPHFLAASIGLAALQLGEYYRRVKQDEYAKYRDFWAKGNSFEDARDSFERANKNRKRAEDYSTGGLIILSADALFFAYRWWMIEKSQRVYDQYCNSERGLSWNLSPTVEWAFGPQSYAGLTFQMQF